MSKLISILLATLFLAFSVQAKESKEERKAREAREKKEKRAKENAEIIKLTGKLTRMKGTTPAQWRVIWTGDASKEATVSWSTAESGKSHKVYYGETSRLGKVQNCQRSGEYTLNKKESGKIESAF